MLLNWVEIDATALRHNLRGFRRALGPDVALGAVVKSNAYGHGVASVAPCAMACGVRRFAVFSAEEAVGLLERAVANGFGYKAWLENDSDFDKIRQHPRFIALLDSME